MLDLLIFFCLQLEDVTELTDLRERFQVYFSFLVVVIWRGGGAGKQNYKDALKFLVNPYLKFTLNRHFNICSPISSVYIVENIQDIEFV